LGLSVSTGPGRTTAALILGVLVIPALLSAPSGSLAARSSGDAPSSVGAAQDSPSYSTPTSSCFYNATESGNWNDPGVWSSTPAAPFPNTVPAGCTVNIPESTVVTVPDGLSVVVLGTVQNGASLVVNEYASIIFRGMGTLNNGAHGSVSTNVGSAFDNHGGVINNDAGGQITIGNSATFYNRGNSTISNAGTITVQAGAELLSEGRVQNSGSISDKGLIENLIGGTITNLATGTINDDYEILNEGAISNVGSITNSGAITNNGTIQGSGIITGRLVTPATIVSCSPDLISVDSRASCTVRMLGTMDLTDGEAVSFASSSDTGSFSPSASCTLESGSCSVTYEDSAPGSPKVTADYPGDSNDRVSSGNTTITVSESTVGAAAATSATSLTSIAPTTTAAGSPGLPLTYLVGAAAVVVIIISAALSGRARGRRRPPSSHSPSK